VRVRSRTRTADLVTLDRARVVLGVGLGVDPADYPLLSPLLERLDAALACTRPVADRRWLPSGRQVGLTGRALAPRLYLTVGSSGAFEHLVGVAGAGTILAVDPARDATVFRAADVGIVADWRDVVGRLAAAVRP
jgi:electron transfer flavoprotein alpha subunit